jgi:hypothetical protein
MTRPELGHEEHERPRDRLVAGALGSMCVGLAVIVAGIAAGWLP